MFDLNDAVDRWLAETMETQPGLAPYADEIGDHLISASEANIARGMDPADAFAAAVEALGQPSVLAGEFRKDGGVVAVLHRLTKAETTPTRRQELAIASAWILMSLFWAGVMIVIQDSMMWVLFVWTVTTYLPLTIIGTMMSKRYPRAKCT